ncbi:MAG TPA: HD domain-containing protein [Candidatus Saccharimonadales bacterium]|nr:HD domain-containing protein [Candidatus Saccharimonadales bacterium]
MSNSQILEKTRAFVRENMKGDGVVHNWWHIVRVVEIAKKIARKEGADLFVVELGALLHDIADWKFTDGDTSIGPRMTKEWLESLKVDEQVIENVVEIVEHISFRGGTNKHVLSTLEGKIVQDADRMDAIGAIGIAKTFAYSGVHKRQIYDPDNPPKKYKNFDEFRSKMHDTSTINHFHEKLLLLKDKMNTKTGRAMAEHRHKYMEQFLEEFYAEWDGKY